MWPWPWKTLQLARLILLMDMLITLIRVRTQVNTADAQHKIDYQLLSIFLFFKNASTVMSSDWLSKYADEL